MENVGVYTVYLQRISSLNSKELDLETINEAHTIYMELKCMMSKLEKNAQVEMNGCISLINEIRYVLFDLIKKSDAPISNRIRKRLALELEENENILENIVTVNNHAFVVTKNDNDDVEVHLVNDYLMDITNRKFLVNETGQNNLQKEELLFLKSFIDELNETLKTVDIKGNYPYLELDNNGAIYQNKNNNMHIYVSHNIYDIIEKTSHLSDETIEIIIEDNASNYYFLDVSMINGKIRIALKDFDKWELITKEKQNIKIKR